MKKRYLFSSILVIALCFFLVGCGNGNNNENNENNNANTNTGTNTNNEGAPQETTKKDEWSSYGLLVYNNKQDKIDSKFYKATANYEEEHLEPVALLGTQVVAGTNYMYLCRVKPERNNEGLLDSTEFRVAILYVDTNGDATITKVTKFDITDYALKDISLTQEQLEGGWTVNHAITSNVAYINSEVDNVKAATEGLTGATYKPLVVLSEKRVSDEETYSALLCLKTTTTQNPTYSMTVLTYKETGSDEFTYSLESVAELNLADFNK